MYTSFFIININTTSLRFFLLSVERIADLKLTPNDQEKYGKMIEELMHEKGLGVDDAIDQIEADIRSSLPEPKPFNSTCMPKRMRGHSFEEFTAAKQAETHK